MKKTDETVSQGKTVEKKEKATLRSATRELLAGGTARQIVEAIADKARAGDLKCAEFLRDVAGEKSGKGDEGEAEQCAPLTWDEKMDIIRRLRYEE